MQTYISNFDDFIGESRAFTTKEEDRTNADRIWQMMNGDKNFGFICTLRFTDEVDDNEERLEKLVDDIKKLECEYVPFKYGYSCKEATGSITRTEDNGWFVSGIELRQLLELGEEYEQDIIVFGNKDEVKSYNVSTGEPDLIMGNADMKLSMLSMMFFPGTFKVAINFGDEKE